jgi:hypothetical protein
MAEAPRDRSAANAQGRPFKSERSIGVGAATNTNIAITGIRIGTDLLDTVIFFPKAAEPLPSVLTAEASITSDGNIQCTTTTTTNGRLLVFWRKHVA